MNVLTFDIEEWFHLLDFDATRTETEWERYEVRIFDNVERIMNILEDTDTKATFFIIGWIAKKYPELVRKISEKYQIGSHTMNHQLVWQQSPSAFRKDVCDSIKLLEDITGKQVDTFRAPGFSIRESESWAIDILAESGIKNDCSVFPAFHAHGGMPSFAKDSKKIEPSIIRHNGIEIREFPIPIQMILGKPLIFSGGGYFRLCPYPLVKLFTKYHPDYVLSYIHPRDMDAGQPMLTELPTLRKFKSYVGLKGAEKKVRRYLSDFSFVDVATAVNIIDWNKAPQVELM